MAGELIYVYCVTWKEPNLKDLDLSNNISSLQYQDIYTVIRKVSEDEFSQENLKKNLSDMKWVELKTREHIKVVSKVMESSTVVPFKFGTIFKTEESLKKMLQDYSQQIKDNIAKLEGKEEWAVKIYCEFKVLNEEIAQDNREIKKLDQEINLSSPGKAYLLKKKKEELLNIAVKKKINEYGQVSFDRLREKSTQARITKLLPKEVTERNDEMILNSSFLINKDKVEDFLNIVEEIRTEYTDKGLFFDCTGPWPPYNFCNFSKEIKSEREN